MSSTEAESDEPTSEMPEHEPTLDDRLEAETHQDDPRYAPADELEALLASAESNLDTALAEPVRHRPRNTSGRDAIMIRALIRDTQAVRMRVEGKSYPAIAAALHYGHRGNAQRAIQRRLRSMRTDCSEAVTEVRLLENTRLDVALAAIMPKVRDGDLHAIDRLLRIQERRAAYEGLDQPRGLKVEMARELDGFIGRLREEFDDPTFERVLALIAGEYGGAPAGGAPDQEDSGEGDTGGGLEEVSPGTAT